MIGDQELFLQTGYRHTLDNPIVIHWPKMNTSYYRKGPLTKTGSLHWTFGMNYYRQGPHNPLTKTGSMHWTLK